MILWVNSLAFAFFLTSWLYLCLFPVVLVPAAFAPGLPWDSFIRAVSALTGFFPLQPNLSDAEPAGLFSFGRLAPGLVILPPGFSLFFDSPRGDSGLPDLPGLFPGFGPCQVKGVLESSFLL